MGILRERVNDILGVQKKKKWQVLKECCEDDIKKMIDEGVPIRIQLKLILESGVIERLTLSEYYKMLKNHFGYTGRKERVRVFEVSEKKETNEKKYTQQTHNTYKDFKSKRRSVKEALKKDINILKVAGIDVDEALNKINRD